MDKVIPDSEEVLIHLLSGLIEASSTSIRNFKLLFQEMTAAERQTYLINLKSLVGVVLVREQRSTEKAYLQLMIAINEMLKESYYKGSVSKKS